MSKVVSTPQNNALPFLAGTHVSGLGERVRAVAYLFAASGTT